jgi:acyl-CoA dehydrogenase
MDFSRTDRERQFHDRVRRFLDEKIRPCHADVTRQTRSEDRWRPLEAVERLKVEAKADGLWNLFMPPPPQDLEADKDFVFTGERLSNVEYAHCAEEMGRVEWASEVFNCSAPDTGNMEILNLFGTPDQKARWLKPLMDGVIRSAFLMTEPEVGSSDATNIRTTIRREGDEYVINGRKWWSSGIGTSHCKVAIVMGKTDPDAEIHRQQSMVLVDLDTPGLKIERMLNVFGYDHAPHGHAEISLTDVRVPVGNILLGEGRGFEIAQRRLGPGRVHHCMRIIGAAEEALEAMSRRLLSRVAFGKRLFEYSIWDERLAQARIDIEMTRLLCLKAADMMDRAGNKAARNEIAMIKVQAPRMAVKIIDDAIQAHGGAGVCDDYDLAAAWTHTRALRIADGPDEVHMRSIARTELKKYREPRP